jgi:hypothetical protein
MFLLAALCCRDAIPFSLYGEVKNVTTGDNGWAYFSVAFGDFGHNVRIRAWNGSTPVKNFYMDNNHNCPTNTSSQTNSSGPAGAPVSDVFMAGGTAQYRVFGFDAQAKNVSVVVSVASIVRPIHAHTTAEVIHAIFIFFGVNFVVTGFLQFYFFKNSMDPNEYLQPSG